MAITFKLHGKLSVTSVDTLNKHFIRNTVTPTYLANLVAIMQIQASIKMDFCDFELFIHNILKSVIKKKVSGISVNLSILYMRD